MCTLKRFDPCLFVVVTSWPPWWRASKAALNTGAFFRTSGPIPAESLAARQDMIVDGRAGVALPAGVWFAEPVREMTIFAEQYDFAVTLLLLKNRDGYTRFEAEPEEGVYDRFTSGVRWRVPQ
jgi:hypothetical protein